MSTILVTGATGTVGLLLVQRLAAAGASVRAMVRNPKSASASLPAGVEIVRGDMDDPASVAAALRGAELAALITPADPALVDREQRFIAAARSAGLRLLVKLSVINAHPAGSNPFARWHARAELALVDSDIPFTIIQPNFYMQNLLAHARTVCDQGVIYGCTGRGAASHVDAADIAEVMASVLLAPPADNAGKVHIVTGPEALTLEQIAEHLAAALDRPVRAVDVPDEQYRSMLTATGAPAWLADAVVDLQRMARRGEASMVTDTVRRVGGKAPTTLDQWAKANASSFR